MDTSGTVLGSLNVNLWDQIFDLFTFGTQPNSLGQLVTKLVDLMIIVAIIIALFFLMVSAINWITSEGKPDKLEQARNNLIHAIIGLVIAVAAYVIWLLIVKQFLRIPIDTGVNLSSPTGTTGTTPGSGSGTGAPVCAANIPIGGCGQVSYGGTWYRCLAPNSPCSSYTRTYDYQFLCPDPTCP